MSRVRDVRMLIVDDNEVSRFLLHTLLKEQSYFNIEEASDGAKALKLVCEFVPHVVFLDIELPGMRGLDLLVKIRNLLPKALVFMVTSHADRETVEEAKRRGAAGYILKPFSAETVLKQLELIA